MRPRAYGKNKVLFDKHYRSVLDLRRSGYGYGTISKKLNIPVHLVISWSKHIVIDLSESVSIGNLYRTKSFSFLDYRGVKSRKEYLIRKRGRRCEKCKRETWLGRPIVLELHNHDKEEAEAQVLCPNCHSQTNDWRGRGKLPK